MSEGMYSGLPISAGGNLPDPVVGEGTYPAGGGVCACVWRLLYGDGDTDDIDSLPDVNHIPDVTIRIRPSRRYVTWRGEHPTTLLLRDVECKLEGDHLVSPAGKPYVILVPTTGGGFTETGWTYLATVEQAGQILHSLQFEAPANTSIDLTLLTDTGGDVSKAVTPLSYPPLLAQQLRDATATVEQLPLGDAGKAALWADSPDLLRQAFYNPVTARALAESEVFMNELRKPDENNEPKPGLVLFLATRNCWTHSPQNPSSDYTPWWDDETCVNALFTACDASIGNSLITEMLNDWETVTRLTQSEKFLILLFNVFNWMDVKKLFDATLLTDGFKQATFCKILGESAYTQARSVSFSEKALNALLSSDTTVIELLKPLTEQMCFYSFTTQTNYLIPYMVYPNVVALTSDLYVSKQVQHGDGTACNSAIGSLTSNQFLLVRVGRVDGAKQRPWYWFHDNGQIAYTNNLPMNPTSMDGEAHYWINTNNTGVSCAPDLCYVWELFERKQ